jgi:hypothetical protein
MCISATNLPICRTQRAFIKALHIVSFLPRRRNRLLYRDQGPFLVFYLLPVAAGNLEGSREYIFLVH